MKVLPVHDSNAVFGRDESLYQCVLDDFKRAKYIGIMTYNISLTPGSRLLKSLKKACLNGTNAVIITNIPKRFSRYFNEQFAIAAQDMIKSYIQRLDPQKYGMRLTPFFAFHNHAKIIMTENIVYWGSSNFSDESGRNFECGTISKDKKLIAFLKNTLFPEEQHRSVPFYKYNFAVAMANLKSLIPACKVARKKLFNAAFEPCLDDENGLMKGCTYRVHDSGVTVDFLRGFLDFFSQFEDALDVIDSITKGYHTMIDINKIVDKEFTETNGGYNKDEVDEFLDHICDELEEEKKITAMTPQQSEAEKIYDKTRVNCFEILSGALFFVGLLISVITAQATGRFSFELLLTSFLPWAIGSIISIGISFILDALYKIHDKS